MEFWFSEIEGRPVAKGSTPEGTVAFVWGGGFEDWGPAGGLVRKTGSTLSQSDLQKEFPKAFASMSELKRLAKRPSTAAFE